MRRCLCVLGLLLLASPCSAAFSYYRSITIDHTLCGSGDSVNFPVVVETTNAAAGTKTSLKSVGNGGNVQSGSGYDIYFYSDSGLTTRLPAERVTWSATTGIGEWWVKVATVSASSDTVIYMAYGDAGIVSDPNSDATYGKTSVWTNSFNTTWHFPDGSTLSGSDSTANAHTASLGATAAATGQMDGGANFNVGGATATASYSPSLPLTWQGWIKLNQNGSATFLTDPNNKLNFRPNQSANHPRVTFNGVADYDFSTLTISTSAWQFVAMTISGNNGTTTVYIGSAGTLSSEGQSTGTPGALGGLSASGTFFDYADEAQDSSVVRSTDWLTTAYRNQYIPDKNNAGGFYTVGAETASGGGSPATPCIIGGGVIRPGCPGDAGGLR